MSKTKRSGARKFAVQRARRKRNKAASKQSICKGRVKSPLPAEAFGVELCPISGLPEYIFSGHGEKS